MTVAVFDEEVRRRHVAVEAEHGDESNPYCVTVIEKASTG